MLNECDTYRVTRQDDHGQVIRGKFAYAGDALEFAKVKVAQEINPCLWRVRNVKHDLLLARWRYQAGRIEKEV